MQAWKALGAERVVLARELSLEEIREMAVTIGDSVEKALGLQRGQSAPQRDEAR